MPPAASLSVIVPVASVSPGWRLAPVAAVRRTVKTSSVSVSVSSKANSSGSVTDAAPGAAAARIWAAGREAWRSLSELSCVPAPSAVRAKSSGVSPGPKMR